MTEVTQILSQIESGDPSAAEQLMGIHPGELVLHRPAPCQMVEKMQNKVERNDHIPPAGQPTATGSWQPLLTGDLKDRALETVQVIVDCLPSWQVADATLAGGATGVAVFHAYLARSGYGPLHEATARRLLEKVVAAAAEAELPASLYEGLAGVGWALAHVRPLMADLDLEDVSAEIDAGLREHLGTWPWKEDYDLINGLVGLGVAAMERLPRPHAAACLERVIDRLADTAERRPDGLTWWTNPAWLIPETREKCPRGYYDLGLAHGVPGVIALLGQACAVGVAVAKARPLLDGAVRWLVAQQPADGLGFTHFIESEKVEPPKPARLAWCYGDPGIAAALLLAARSVAEPAWEQAALNIALRAAARPIDQAGVVDAGLCHGAAGLGHLFNRLYQATGDEQLADAARFWLRRTLELRHPKRGIAGYAAWTQLKPGDDRWLDDPGILTGVAGIALALLAATTIIEPSWDRMLLVSGVEKLKGIQP